MYFLLFFFIYLETGLNCPISDEDMMQVNQGKPSQNPAGILGNVADPLKRKSGCQDEDSINEVLYAAQVRMILSSHDT